MGMAQEFREFAVKGNVIDLAVGVIIGGAFGKIVDSVVSDLIMPVVGLVFGKLDFSNMFIALGKVPEGTAMTLEAVKKAGVPVFAYGNFITVAVGPRGPARGHRAAARNPRQSQALTRATPAGPGCGPCAQPLSDWMRPPHLARQYRRPYHGRGWCVPAAGRG